VTQSLGDKSGDPWFEYCMVVFMLIFVLIFGHFKHTMLVILFKMVLCGLEFLYMHVECFTVF